MIRFIYLTIKIIFIIILSGQNIFAQSDWKFAEELMKQKDYFRAITEFKRIHFYSDDSLTQSKALFGIGRAYYLSKKYKSSIYYLTKLLNKGQSAVLYKSQANLFLGLNYYRMKVYPMSIDFLNRSASMDQKGKPDLVLALLEAERGKWSSSSTSFRHISENFKGTPEADIAGELSKYVIKGRDLRRKSPLAAGFFSAVIPGSGQYYSDHHYDALLSFFYVGFFSYASYLAYQYDRSEDHGYTNTAIAVGITSFFYVGNILGATKTAAYHNARQKQSFLEHARSRVLSLF
jgi:tetratricopeptide (TPR) repeat protein